MKNLLQIALLGILTCHLLQEASSKKIIAVEFFGSKSHVLTYLPLLEELTRRGHSVTLLSPMKGLSKPGTVTEVYSFDGMEDYSSIANMTLFEMKDRGIQPNPWTMLTIAMPKHCAALYDRPDAKKLMEEKWDLVFVQPLFNECSMGFVHKIMQKSKAPLIHFLPTATPNFIISMNGGHHPSSFVSNIFLGFRDEMTFSERFMNTAMNFVFEAIYSFYYVPAMEKVYREKLGEDVPSSKEIMGSASLILENGHFSLSRPKPNLPNVVQVGGIHGRPAKPLLKDLEEFVSGSGSDGFILFSLGTILNTTEMPVGKRDMFLKVFSQFKQRVIWKIDDPSRVSNVPKNVKLVKWMPQQDLLGHKKCKMFITHCGLGGTEEAIYYKVPLLGIPFFGDQPLNAKEAENHGFLYNLDWNDITEKTLTDSINEVLNNPKYRENVNRLSKVFQDQIDSPLERGVWWVEYVLRHNGAPQLSTPAKKLNYFQYHSWDVFTIFGIITFLVIFIPYQGLKFICRKLCGSSKTSAGITNKKKTN